MGIFGNISKYNIVSNYKGEINMGYDYKKCCSEIFEFSKTAKGVRVFSIGESVMEKKLYCIEYGRGRKKLFINGAHHGLEYITAAFLMRFLRCIAKAYESGEDLFGYDVKRLLEEVSIFVVPMVNPDGVDIAINGLDITNRYHRRLISMVGIHSFNKVWQANARGVDINHNYDARWNVIEKNPSPTKFGGHYSESEPETKAICDFVKSENFDMLMAFHSQGGEIYYDFDGLAGEKDREIAKIMSAASGYPVRTVTGTASFGGCKDWFIKEFGKSGFTIEMGHGKNPLPEKQLDDIFLENSRIILSAIESLAA